MLDFRLISLGTKNMLERSWQRFLAKPMYWLFKTILSAWFQVTVRNENNQLDSPTIIIANCTSKIDPLLLALFFSERLSFVLPPQLANKLWIKILSVLAEVIFLDLSQLSDKELLINALRTEKSWVLFPQEFTREVKSFDDYGFVLGQLQKKVSPLRIEGAQHSFFSLAKDKYAIHFFPKITLHLMRELSFIPEQNKSIDEKRIGRKLFLLMSEMSFANFNPEKSLFSAILQGAKHANKQSALIEDSKRQPISFRQFIARCFILGRQFKKETQVAEIVGVMMPSTIAGIISVFALQGYRRVPAMLNFSSGFYNLYSICQIAGIKTIYSSRQFIQTAKLEALVGELSAAGFKLKYLEDFAPQINLAQKVAGLLKALLPNLTYSLIGKAVKPTDTALVLFTSGSEGVPKGVPLSHKNILANCYQMMSRVDFSAQDIFFNALPIFHCFGLTAGSIVPLLSGNSCFFYPSPLHFKLIARLVYETKASIFFATDTFLTGYARAARPKDFSSLRYIFAGAEKVKPETIHHWQETFNAQIYEGYGATEASPVISLNCPLASREDSIGLALPAIEYRIEPVEGIAEGGRLFIRGPNVMAGYLTADTNKSIENDGWYDTGDIVSTDEDGFLFINGRVKRFAKLGGEMISLSVVESIASALWPEQLHAALSRKCPRRGEQIILFSEYSEASKSAFVHHVHSQKYPEILVPQAIFSNVKIPLLASGKIDYPSLERNLASFFSDPPSTEASFL
ncbi:bifunctional 2-acylglycerophosphoethanolamine acyltransferase/Acyl-(acyl-carrier-protein) synthetase aas protein [Legionella nautarum]|uniref:Bifunctional 2-acylglycerophosphoethanolamine acyltransferase/Acyl-(Acyl-carrier-protein) synthetase aas protein n=2 Tax=Legionella nautarum TaxID=45070 RepID=A0A0W0WK91_9GAMM|nr:bifunctional 2-acylglycerophosphoethanolamine acyltransferase/Acyl-(acyl-carrier-protein) synthetase aas protein [Legionella nautarum]